MSEINKKELSETDICDLFITPSIKEAGWDPIRQIRRESNLDARPCYRQGQYVALTGEKLPGWDRKPTDRPTSFMMTTKFTGIMVIKIGNERRLSKPLHTDQEAFLMALGIKPSWLIRPQPG